MTTSSIFEQVREMGIPFDNHESDLYVPVNDQTTALIKAHEITTATVFVSQIDGKRWYDLPFRYSPWWEARCS